jgi:hypothetical protein
MRSVRRRCHDDAPVEDLDPVAWQLLPKPVGSIGKRRLVQHHSHGPLLSGTLSTSVIAAGQIPLVITRMK